MDTQIITVPMEKPSADARQVLCAECAAHCARLAGVRATEWSVNHATNTVRGIVKWTEQEMIAEGAETKCMLVASLRDADRLLHCQEIACPGNFPGGDGL